MSDDVSHQPAGRRSPCADPVSAPAATAATGHRRAAKPRVRKLRLLAILVGLGALAIISTIFGMMMAVASDLPQLENQAAVQEGGQLLPLRRPLAPDRAVRAARQRGHRLTRPISPRRCRTRSSRSRTSASESNPGVDLRGIAPRVRGRRHRRRPPGRLDDRPAVRQERAGPAEQPHGVREAARGRAGLPPRPPWTKEKILTEYLNSIYFGNGAYGIESAARVYFGKEHHFYSDADPLGHDHVQHPGLRRRHGVRRHADPQVRVGAGALGGRAAGRHGRRPERLRSRSPIPRPHAIGATSCCSDMYEQHYISATEYARDVNQPLPTAATSSSPASPPPRPTSPAGCARRSWPRWGSGTACRPTWPSTAPTTAACRSAPRSISSSNRPPSRRSAADLPYTQGWPRRLAGRDRQQDRRGARDGRRPDRQRPRGLQPVPVQPRHPGPPPARLVVQAVHARGGARVRREPRTTCSPPRRSASSCPTAAARSTSSCTTSATATRA